MKLPGSACAPCERPDNLTSHTLRRIVVQDRRSAHHTKLDIGRNLFGLGWQRKPEDRALTDPIYEETAAADTALGPRFNRAGEKADPGQFLGEFRSVEIQASRSEGVGVARGAS